MSDKVNDGRVHEGDYAKRQKVGKEQEALSMLKSGMPTAEVSRRTGISIEWLNLKRSRRRF